MKPHMLLPLLLVVIIPEGRSYGQQNPDPKQAQLATAARLETMTDADFMAIMAKAETGDAEAQYLIYAWRRLFTGLSSRP